jgi:hypothetical protein
MRLLRYFNALILVAAIAAPVARAASPANPSDDDHHKVHRYYDRKHHDYHAWNAHESGFYVRWEGENHRKHREFSHRQRADQARYWEWRHNHPD